LHVKVTGQLRSGWEGLVKRPISLILVALAAVGMLFLQQLGAAAHVSRSQPTINISQNPKGTVGAGDRVVVSGDIRGRTLCRSGRVVTLFEVRAGADQRLDTDRSDGDGEFRFVLRPDDDMTVYAKIKRLVDRAYNHRHVCRRARSENQGINVSG
jgi:hypothetical protein